MLHIKPATCFGSKYVDIIRLDIEPRRRKL